MIQMKHIRIIIGLIICLCQPGYGQVQNSRSELQLHIAAGVKFIQPKYLGHAENISPGSAPTLGGGALWLRRSFDFGAEFCYTDGKKHSANFETILTGINFTLLGGYKWNLGQKYRVSIQSGFGYSLNHLSMTDTKYSGGPNLNTAIYHNMIYSVPVAATMHRIRTNGTFASASSRI
jgi:hypothetical protein